MGKNGSNKVEFFLDFVCTAHARISMGDPVSPISMHRCIGLSFLCNHSFTCISLYGS